MNIIAKKEEKIIQILWIPGLGANEIMYIPLLKELNKIYHNNINNTFLKFYDTEPYKIKSLEEYCDYIYEKNFNKLNKYYDYIIACSMGGMILQIFLQQKKIHAKYYILLSTAFGGNDITILGNLLGRFLYLLPLIFRIYFQKFISFSYRIYRYNIKYVRQFSKMFEEFPTNVFFEAPTWIRKWQGIDINLLYHKNIFVIHGTSDPLISFKKISKKRKPNLIFKKGSHILFSLYPKILADRIHQFSIKNK